MTKIVIIHGSNGSPDENWIPFLKDILLQYDVSICTPRLPVGENQTLKNWEEAFTDQVGDLDKDSILVGHSLACVFILHLLSQQPSPIKAAFLVSPFLHLLYDPDINRQISTFVDQNFDWDHLRFLCPDGLVFCSDNDPYVPVHMSEEVAEKMLLPIRCVHNAGHFNSASGYDTFEELEAEISKLIRQ